MTSQPKPEVRLDQFTYDAIVAVLRRCFIETPLNPAWDHQQFIIEATKRETIEQVIRVLKPKTNKEN